MSSPAETRCGWRVQRGTDPHTGRPALVRVDRGGIAEYFSVDVFEHLDDEAFSAIMEAKAAKLGRRPAAGDAS